MLRPVRASAACFLGVLALAASLAGADPVRVRAAEGDIHGFLFLRSEAGDTLKNLPTGAGARGHWVAFTPRPQLLATMLREQGEDRYYTGDSGGTLTRYLGKTPPDGAPRWSP